MATATLWRATTSCLSDLSPHVSHMSCKHVRQPPPPHVSKKPTIYDIKCRVVWRKKRLPFCKVKGASQILWHMNPEFYGIQTPTFMPREPILLGIGVVFNIDVSKCLPTPLQKALSHLLCPKALEIPETLFHIAEGRCSKKTTRTVFLCNLLAISEGRLNTCKFCWGI